MNPPHNTDRQQRKDNRVNQFVHQAVGQLCQWRVELKARGKPTVNQIKAHGNKQKQHTDRIHDRVLRPHDGNGAYHAGKHQWRSTVYEQGR